MNFAFPAWSPFRPTPPVRHVTRPCPRGERRAAVGGATAEETNGEARRGGRRGRANRPARKKPSAGRRGVTRLTCFQTETENAVLRRLRSYEYGRRREERPTTHACPALDPLSLRAEASGTCPKCPDRTVGDFLPLPGKDHTGQPSWTRPAFPIISSLQLTFSLPDLQALILSPILADTPLNCHIRKESGHYHAHASGFRSWVPHLMVT